jgi:hypothetical protein
MVLSRNSLPASNQSPRACERQRADWNQAQRARFRRRRGNDRQGCLCHGGWFNVAHCRKDARRPAKESKRATALLFSICRRLYPFISPPDRNGRIAHLSDATATRMFSLSRNTHQTSLWAFHKACVPCPAQPLMLSNFCSADQQLFLH